MNFPQLERASTLSRVDNMRSGFLESINPDLVVAHFPYAAEEILDLFSIPNFPRDKHNLNLEDYENILSYVNILLDKKISNAEGEKVSLLNYIVGYLYNGILSAEDDEKLIDNFECYNNLIAEIFAMTMKDLKKGVEFLEEEKNMFSTLPINSKELPDSLNLFQFSVVELKFYLITKIKLTLLSHLVKNPRFLDLIPEISVIYEEYKEKFFKYSENEADEYKVARLKFFMLYFSHYFYSNEFLRFINLNSAISLNLDLDFDTLDFIRNSADKLFRQIKDCHIKIPDCYYKEKNLSSFPKDLIVEIKREALSGFDGAQSLFVFDLKGASNIFKNSIIKEFRDLDVIYKTRNSLKLEGPADISIVEEFQDLGTCISFAVSKEDGELLVPNSAIKYKDILTEDFHEVLDYLRFLIFWKMREIVSAKSQDFVPFASFVFKKKRKGKSRSSKTALAALKNKVEEILNSPILEPVHGSSALIKGVYPSSLNIAARMNFSEMDVLPSKQKELYYQKK